jgi:hypothetical protein
VQVVWGMTTSSVPAVPAGSAAKLVSLEQVESLGRRHPRAHQPPGPSDVATICYTSGTTGVPKGGPAAASPWACCSRLSLGLLLHPERGWLHPTCGAGQRQRAQPGAAPDPRLCAPGAGAVISHGNLIAASAATCIVIADFEAGNRHISYLPLAHIYERVNLVTCVHQGASVGFYSGNVQVSAAGRQRGAAGAAWRPAQADAAGGRVAHVRSATPAPRLLFKIRLVDSCALLPCLQAAGAHRQRACLLSPSPAHRSCWTMCSPSSRTCLCRCRGCGTASTTASWPPSGRAIPSAASCSTRRTPARRPRWRRVGGRRVCRWRRCWQQQWQQQP